MISNAVTLLNPYYTAMGITERLKADVKSFYEVKALFLNKDIMKVHPNYKESSLFNGAFSKSNYVAYASQNIYLNDNNAFIEK